MKNKKRREATNSFLGAVITPRTRRTYLERFRNDYLKRVENAGNPDNLNDHELRVMSNGYAKTEVSREKQHLKAYLKGDTYYKSYGRTFPVLTTDVFAQQAALQESNAKVQLKEEEE